MKTSYRGKLIRITFSDGSYYSIIPKSDFDNLIKRGITRKKAPELGIGSRIWNNSYNYHYNKDEINSHRVDKIKTTNAQNRYTQWRDSLSKLETISPGISDLVLDNLKDNPELIMDELERLSDLFYEMKIFMRQSKKYIRQACIRKGVPYKKMVANTSEYQLKVLLKSLFDDVEVQPYIEKYWYDFRVGNYLIELDGESYHTDERDRLKENIAEKHGFNVIRFSTDELKNKVTLIEKINRHVH